MACVRVGHWIAPDRARGRREQRGLVGAPLRADQHLERPAHRVLIEAAKIAEQRQLDVGHQEGVKEGEALGVGRGCVWARVGVRVSGASASVCGHHRDRAFPGSVVVCVFIVYSYISLLFPRAPLTESPRQLVGVAHTRTRSDSLNGHGRGHVGQRGGWGGTGRRGGRRVGGWRRRLATGARAHHKIMKAPKPFVVATFLLVVAGDAAAEVGQTSLDSLTTSAAPPHHLAIPARRRLYHCNGLTLPEVRCGYCAECQCNSPCLTCCPPRTPPMAPPSPPAAPPAGPSLPPPPPAPPMQPAPPTSPPSPPAPPSVPPVPPPLPPPLPPIIPGHLASTLFDFAALPTGWSTGEGARPISDQSPGQ